MIRTDVRNGVVLLQYELGTLPAASGRAFTTSQLLLYVFPVLTPPWSRMPFDSRAVPPMSTPFQCWYRFAPFRLVPFTRIVALLAEMLLKADVTSEAPA